ELFLGALCTVLGARQLAVFHALQIERTTDDVIANTRKILHTAAAHQHDRVLLQVVAFTADIRNNFETVGQAHFGDFTQCRVRLFGSGGVHAGADTTALRAVFGRGALAAFAADFARLAHELTNGWHGLYVSCSVELFAY